MIRRTASLGAAIRQADCKTPIVGRDGVLVNGGRRIAGRNGINEAPFRAAVGSSAVEAGLGVAMSLLLVINLAGDGLDICNMRIRVARRRHLLRQFRVTGCRGQGLAGNRVLGVHPVEIFGPLCFHPVIGVDERVVAECHADRVPGRR